MSPRAWLSVGGVAAFSVVSGCVHVAAPKGVAELRSDEYEAAYRIAAARCDRQTPRCTATAGARYATRDACIEAKLWASAVEAELPDCEQEIVDEGALESCLSQIRQRPCGTGVTSLEACRPKQLCPFHADEGTVRRDAPTRPVALTAELSIR